MLGRLAVHAALAMQNAQLYCQVQAELVKRQKAEAALAQAAAELEQRVAARTEALRRAIVERRRLEREAQRAQYVVLLGRLAAGVSHEIRNPLAAVLHTPSPDSRSPRPPATGSNHATGWVPPILSIRYVAAFRPRPLAV
jgi:signal transduction histidine kinase